MASQALKKIGGGKKSPNKLQKPFQKRRRALLGMVHMAPVQLGMTEEERLATLLRFGVSSSSALSNAELEDLVDYYRGLGWRPRRSKNSPGYASALRKRIVAEAEKNGIGEKRLRGLVEKKAGVADIKFCSDISMLKQILKIIPKIG